MFAEMIQGTREIVGPRPRKLNRAIKKALKSKVPSWIKKDKSDPIYSQYRQRNEIFQNSLVCWGRTVQANVRMFRPGDSDSPAAWLYSLDPYYDEALDELDEIAGSLFDLKGEETGDAELQFFADTLEDEYERHMRLPVPRSLTGGREVYYTCGMVIRKHLPIPLLAAGFFPLIVAPSTSNNTMILPSEFWDHRLTEFWLSMAS